MQGLILAAGMGKRLGKYTNNQTKCMVKVNDKTLIEYALDAFLELNVDKVILVIGFEGEKLKNFIGTNYKGIQIEYVVNQMYDKTNNIYSLWLASKYLLTDDTILLESDIIFDKNILKNLIVNESPNLAVVAKYEHWMDGTVTILDEDDKILSFIPKINFDWNNKTYYYKTVNIYKFSKEFSTTTYIPFLDAYIKAMGNNEYYEQVLRVIAYLDGIDLKAYKLTCEKWYEIDDVQDLDIACALFADDDKKLTLYQQRYGGYWRFPKLKDFCYLVNPYFPTEGLINELKSNFEEVIAQYPSGLNVQNLMAAKMFGCDNSEILVGNGAAELIRGIFEAIEGNIGVIFPTFNEYPESAGYDRVKRLVINNSDFRYTLEMLKDFSSDVKALVLINPDNPSGHFLSKNDVLELLDYLNKKDIFLIYDESFVDFAGEEVSFSLLDSSLLQKYKNLIVVKSISKSYGIPGLRLGIAASGNDIIIKAIRKYLPIWNINSLGELFLQIIDKYKKDYSIACKKICKERDSFYQGLCKIDYLRVLPSHSNYFLCEVINKYTAKELTSILFNRFDILIKDCTGKIGFENKQFVRIAVKDNEDNNYLLQKLKNEL